MLIMLMVGFIFIVKLTYLPLYGRCIVAAIAGLFIIATWETATTQSKTQISDWLSQPQLMLDTSVLLTIDLLFQILFASLMAKKINSENADTHDDSSQSLTGERLNTAGRIALEISRWFPGIMIFPILFFMYVQMIFMLPGIDFSTIAWIAAGCVIVLAPLLSYGFQWLLPERDLRLETLFVLSLITAALGIIATVNGRTAAAGTNSVEWTALATILGLILLGLLSGLIIYRLRLTRLLNK